MKMDLKGGSGFGGGVWHFGKVDGFFWVGWRSVWFVGEGGGVFVCFVEGRK